jgi:hypothetical protein
VKTVVEGVMRGYRLTQRTGPRQLTIVHTDGLCAEFREGARVRVTIERV